MQDAIYLALPFPPSVNDAVHYGKNKRTGRLVAFSSPTKKKFFADADAMFLAQKRALAGKRIEGPFTYHITLNESLRDPRSDGDNRQKYVLDFIQRVGLIQNDKWAAGGSWAWGPCDHPALIGIWPANSSNRVPLTHGTRES